MKVVCNVPNENIDIPSELNITLNKIYTVDYEDEIFYQIIDDNEDCMLYPKEMFKSLSKYRNEKINKLLGL